MYVCRNECMAYYEIFDLTLAVVDSILFSSVCMYVCMYVLYVCLYVCGISMMLYIFQSAEACFDATLYSSRRVIIYCHGNGATRYVCTV